jgi:predicted nucleic acid-binding protein
MNIIADTNIFLAVVLDEPEKEKIIENTEGVNLTSPDILPYEIGNALSAMLKRHKITPSEALPAFEATKIIPVRFLKVDIAESLKIAMEFNLYAYDGYFLQCARLTSYPLYTLDRRMQEVANQLRIPLIGAN